MAKSKREIIIDTIEAGGATMDSLIEAADCKYESVMSNFSMLRLMGKCPVRDVEIEVDGKKDLAYRFVTSEEWEEIKAAKSQGAAKRAVSTKNPAERQIAAEKRVDRCQKAKDGADKRFEADKESALLDLRAQKAAIELKIAEFELDEAKVAVEADPDAVAELEALRAPVEPEPEPEDETEGAVEEVKSADEIDFE